MSVRSEQSVRPASAVSPEQVSPLKNKGEVTSQYEQPTGIKTDPDKAGLMLDKRAQKDARRENRERAKEILFQPGREVFIKGKRAVDHGGVSEDFVSAMVVNYDKQNQQVIVRFEDWHGNIRQGPLPADTVFAMDAEKKFKERSSEKDSQQEYIDVQQAQATLADLQKQQEAYSDAQSEQEYDAAIFGQEMSEKFLVENYLEDAYKNNEPIFIQTSGGVQEKGEILGYDIDKDIVTYQIEEPDGSVTIENMSIAEYRDTLIPSTAQGASLLLEREVTTQDGKVEKKVVQALVDETDENGNITVYYEDSSGGVQKEIIGKNLIVREYLHAKHAVAAQKTAEKQKFYDQIAATGMSGEAYVRGGTQKEKKPTPPPIPTAAERATQKNARMYKKDQLEKIKQQEAKLDQLMREQAQQSAQAAMQTQIKARAATQKDDLAQSLQSGTGTLGTSKKPIGMTSSGSSVDFNLEGTGARAVTTSENKKSKKQKKPGFFRKLFRLY